MDTGITFSAIILMLTISAGYSQPSLAEPLEEESIRVVREQIERVQLEKEKRLQEEPVLKKLNEHLLEMEDAFKKEGKEGAKKHANKRRLVMTDDLKVTVRIFLTPDVSVETFDDTLFESLGGQILQKYPGTIVALLGIDRIRTVAESMEGIEYIGISTRPSPSAQTVGALKKAADASSSTQQTGVAGESKIAVIDVAFGGISSAIQAGELPESMKFINCNRSRCMPADFSADSTRSRSDLNGTAVAEIIHDREPNAQLFLIKYDFDESLLAAVEYCRANGINVIKIVQ